MSRRSSGGSPADDRNIDPGAARAGFGGGQVVQQHFLVVRGGQARQPVVQRHALRSGQVQVGVEVGARVELHRDGRRVDPHTLTRQGGGTVQVVAGGGAFARGAPVDAHRLGSDKVGAERSDADAGGREIGIDHDLHRRAGEHAVAGGELQGVAAGLREAHGGVVRLGSGAGLLRAGEIRHAASRSAEHAPGAGHLTGGFGQAVIGDRCRSGRGSRR